MIIFKNRCNHLYNEFHTEFYFDWNGYRVKKAFLECSECGKKIKKKLWNDYRSL